MLQRDLTPESAAARLRFNLLAEIAFGSAVMIIVGILGMLPPATEPTHSTHHHHPVDGALKQEIVLYVQELKQAGVFRPGTDPAQFADRVCVDVLAT